MFRIGKTKVVADLLDSGFADVHQGTVALGIRHVVCVPLNFVHYVESADARGEDRRIGVLYLDSREKGNLLSDATRAGLETLAAEASVAIENARLYREKLEKSRMEQEMRIAAEIQQALLPKPRASLGFVEAAAASIPCRSIGGDFFDYLDDPGTSFGFTLGDVAGKGPPAALMSALMQGMFASNALLADGPAAAVSNMNKALCRRGLESRFVTLMFGVVATDGQLTYCNAGHNPPIVVGKRGLRHLEAGGPVVGLLEFAPYGQETVQLESGDTIIIFSDGVSEALNSVGDEFGDARLQVSRRVAGPGDGPEHRRSRRRRRAHVHERRGAKRRHHRHGDPLSRRGDITCPGASSRRCGSCSAWSSSTRSSISMSPAARANTCRSGPNTSCAAALNPGWKR